MESCVVNPVSKMLSAALTRGLLEVKVDEATMVPESLFGFAERRNPKRAFLFVSRVLGRHIPVRPSVMQASYERLAAKIPADLPGPVLIMGMAETAVGLGAGVHRAYSAARPDSVYMVSTRHPVGTELLTRFEEEHSHASAHLIHMPIDLSVIKMMLRARSLVLVDDEASTGKTFVNLHRALLDAGLKDRATEFCNVCWTRLMRPAGLRAVADEVESGAVVTLCSASPALVLKPFAERLGINLIGTELEVIDGRLTGRIAGANCRCETKVLRLAAIYGPLDQYRLRAWGDTRGDHELLGAAHDAHWRAFHPAWRRGCHQ